MTSLAETREEQALAATTRADWDEDETKRSYDSIPARQIYFMAI